ncbi:MAG: DUF4139 domain-containing protein [Pseudomonadota bacterium]
MPVSIHRNSPAWALLPFLGSLAAGVAADEYTVDAAITAVSVTRSGASVTRTATLNVAAGEHTLVMTGLPDSLDLSRLALSLGSDSVALGSVRGRRVYGDALTGESQQTLQDEVDELSYQRGLLDDSIAAAESQLTLLESLSQGKLESTIDSATALSSLLTLVDESGNTARRRIRDARREATELARLIQQKQEQLDQFASFERSSQSAVAAIEATRAQTLMLTATYPVRGASWNWVYEARLETERGFLEIIRKVALAQQTGESWDDVELTISTANTASRIAPPEYVAQSVTLQSDLARYAQSAASAARRAEPEVEEVVVQGAFFESAMDAVGTEYEVSFAVPGRVSVSTGAEQQLFEVDRRGTEVELVATSRPIRDAHAYLEARFTHDEEFPMQPGRMLFYRDGSYIGSRPIAGFLPGEESRLPFGVDSRIQVRVIADEESSDAQGSFFRTAVENVRKRILITSFHEQVKEIDVFASLPVSKNEDVDVSYDDDASRPTERAVNDNTGEDRWRLTLEPAEQQVIKHFYSVRYPRTEQLLYDYQP